MASIPNTRAIILCDSVVDAIDAYNMTGLLRIYSGAAPANADASLAGTAVLAELTMSRPAFSGAVDANPGATATAAPITQDSSANLGGTATFARIVNASGEACLQVSVSAVGGGGELQLATTTIVSGQPVQVTSFTVTVPEA